MRKVIGNLITVVLIVMIVGMSLLLLSYNEFRVSEFGNNTILLIDDKLLDYEAGSLLIVNKGKIDEIKKGDFVFYYDTSSTRVKTVLTQVKEVNPKIAGEASFTLINDYILNEEYVIGTTKHTKEIKNLGTILSILESKWGFLFLVVIPALMLFLYELLNVIIEVKMYSLHSRRY